jgi:hypothetical protein
MLIVALCLFSSSGIAGTYGGGIGTAEDPYIISDPNHMQAIGLKPEDMDKHFLLVNDIDLSAFDGQDGRAAFNMIGVYGSSFTGVFDGGGHVISNYTYISDSTYEAAMFMFLDDGAEIKNLGLENVFIDTTVGGSTGAYDVAPLVSQMYGGKLTNCYAKGTVKGRDDVGGLVAYIQNPGMIINCFAETEVVAEDDSGGLIGYNGGIVINSYSTGNVTGSGGNIGGLIGYSWGSAKNCYAFGTVTGSDRVGGLIGSNSKGSNPLSEVVNCYSTGSVSGSTNVGGFVGMDYSGDSIFIGCLWDETVNPTLDSVGNKLVDPNAISGKSTLELETQGTFENAGWDFVGGSGPNQDWIMPAEGGYPILAWQLGIEPPEPIFSGGSGDPNDPYIIANLSDLNCIGCNPKVLGKHFRMIADIDLSGQRYYMIGDRARAFTGTFDGAGYVIRNMRYQLKSRDGFGLFRYVSDGASINNLNLESIDINLPDGMYIGGLIGYSEWAEINNCHVSGSVVGKYGASLLVGRSEGGSIINSSAIGEVATILSSAGLITSRFTGSEIRDCYSEGEVSGGDSVGGICGYSSGHIINCNVQVTLSGDEYVGSIVGYGGGSVIGCSAILGSVKGSTKLGGLVGESRGEIRNSHSDVTVTGTGSNVGGISGYSYSDIINCYSLGDINGISVCGGIAGCNYGGAILNCYSSGGVTGGDEVGGIMGSTSQGTMENCYSTATVTGAENTGGLVGEGWYLSAINNYSLCTINGTSYVGGFAGNLVASAISNCYSGSSVTGIGSTGGMIGGGRASTIRYCLSTGHVESTYSTGGFLGTGGLSLQGCLWDLSVNPGLTSSSYGDYPSIKVEGKTTAALQLMSTFTNAGWDFVGENDNGISEIWQMPAGGGYPELSNLNGYVPPVLAGEGNEESPYLISNAAELASFYHYDKRAYYRLISDIDLSGISWGTVPIPYLHGVFDGSGYMISNFSMSGAGHLGFASILCSGSSVKNLRLENLNLYGAEGVDFIGGLAGCNRAVISNCGVSGSVFSLFSGVGSYYVGGLIGYNSATIDNCYAKGSVAGDNNVGGLIGYNEGGNITNCYSLCSVSGYDPVGGLIGNRNYGKFNYCYAAGAVSAFYTEGGLVGKGSSSSSNYINCFWDITINPTMTGIGSATDPVNVIGETTVNLQTQSTFTNAGWDFVGESVNGENEIWRMCVDGVDYPRLSWEFAQNGDFACPDGVGMDDLESLTMNWLTATSIDEATFNYACDANGDEQINFKDYGVLAENWLVGIE